ncbi:2'-5' RNA ligase family protein [Rossellomorea marisflavi]|uniref:2'-5' RNA ligase family protein n=1 Tax=Rossellomorea marisflavi TaxID=189381 RepID=UPI003AE45967
MYAVVAVFNPELERAIIQVWDELKEKGISAYASQVRDRRPHITLGDFPELDPVRFSEDFVHHYCDHSPIEIRLSSIGSFIRTGILYYSPVLSEELAALHRDFHRQFLLPDGNESSLYRPGSWIPHCTIANRLSTDEQLKAFQLVKDREIPQGTIAGLSLLDLRVQGEAPEIATVSFGEQTAGTKVV